MPDLLAGLLDVPFRFWVCPLHPRPERPMTLVVWAGEDATCALCGFTRAEHMQRVKNALAVLSRPER